MKKVLALVLTLVLSVACLGLFTGCGETEEKLVALICLHSDSSTYDANFINAFQAAVKAKGLTKGQYTIITEVPEEGDDCFNKAVDFADQGYKCVFADSFGHEANMIKAAKECPDTQFCHATGTAGGKQLAETDDIPANFHNAFASIYEGRYLAGVAAGLKLNEMIAAGAITPETAKMGYVGAHPYAEVMSGYTSFFLGARSVCPTVTMEVRYTNSWYDEPAEKATALALINNGCKLISGHADSMGAPTACEEKGVPNVFYNGTTTKDTFVIASKINWQPYFELMIDCAMGEATLPRDYVGTIATGSVEVTATGKAAAANTAAKLDEVKGQLAEGLKVFNCANFTVKNAKAEVGDFSKASYITMDEDGHLTAYNADVIDLGDYVGETNVVKTEGGVTYFAESFFRSAPYFDILIDGITVGATVEVE